MAARGRSGGLPDTMKVLLVEDNERVARFVRKGLIKAYDIAVAVLARPAHVRGLKEMRAGRQITGRRSSSSPPTPCNRRAE